MQRLLQNWDQISQEKAKFVLNCIIQMFLLSIRTMRHYRCSNISVDGSAHIRKSCRSVLTLVIIIIFNVENESQITVLVELGLIHGHVGIIQVLTMNDWANRNLVHIILFLIIKEILNNLRILLKMIRLLHQLIPIGLTVSSKKILSASVIWISLNDLSEHDISELEVVRDEIFHLHLSKVQKIAS